MKHDDSLWDAVAREQDAHIASQAPPDVEALQRHLDSRRPPKVTNRRRWILATIPLAAAAAWALWHRVPDGNNLTFAIDGKAADDASSITAPADRPLELRFSDQSLVQLQPGATSQVESLHLAGATIRLYAGSLSTHVRHTDQTRWTVLAGNFAVHVTGTRFLTTYHPDEKSIEVDLHEGSVLVSGGALGNGVSLRAGQRLIASGTLGTYSVMPQRLTDTVSATRFPQQHEPVREPVQEPVQEPGREPNQALALAPEPSPAAAETLAPVPNRAGDSVQASTLLERGDKARYEGDLKQARQAYQTLLERFPRAAEASDALFALARLAFDSGDMRGAGVLFGRYAANHPNGTFHEQALGRWLEALVRDGDSAESRRIARVYIGLYPHGDHLKIARACLQPDGP